MQILESDYMHEDCRYTTSGDGSRFFVVYLTKRVFSQLGETKILLESPSSNLRELEIPN